MDHERRSGLGIAAMGAVGAALLGVSAVVLWSGELAEFKWLNHDAANALYIGRRIHQGDLLYVDWYYFVMPPIVFLASGVCFLADQLGLSPPSVSHLVVVATAVLGVWVLRGAIVARGQAKHPESAAIATLAYVAVLAQPGFFSADFGQREHLFALLLVPHLLWRVSRMPVSVRVVALGIALGYAMMNKPHFIAAVVTIELFFARELRASRRFWAAIFVGAVLPFALLLLHSPDSAEAFFTRAIGYHLSGNYDSYSQPLAEFMIGSFNRQLLVGVSIVAALLSTAWWRRLVDARSALLVATLCIATYLLFLQQQKFFRYHAIPFLATAWVSSALLAWKIAGSLGCRAARRFFEGAVIGLAMLLIAHGVSGLWRTVRSETRTRVEGVLPFLAELDDAKLVALFSPAVEGRLFARTFDRDFEIMGPWTSNYTLGALLHTADPGAREELVRDYFAPIARRIREEAPDLVAFSPRTQSLPDATLHRVIVDRYGLFPSADYPLRKLYDNGWVVYRRRASPEPAGR